MSVEVGRVRIMVPENINGVALREYLSMEFFRCIKSLCLSVFDKAGSIRWILEGSGECYELEFCCDTVQDTFNLFRFVDSAVKIPVILISNVNWCYMDGRFERLQFNVFLGECEVAGWLSKFNVLEVVEKLQTILDMISGVLKMYMEERMRVMARLMNDECLQPFVQKLFEERLKRGV